ncbi:MAG: YabP/YqfC family sporulation protein [Ruminococcus sp.]|nr:YabP/YqfC family sporulation protein [Ruminococcus sp.]
MNNETPGRHSIVMQDCTNLSISGVTDADSFDENRIQLFTECGEMAVIGENLHVNEMNVDTGRLTVEGTVTAIIYGDRAHRKRPSFLARLLR